MLDVEHRQAIDGGGLGAGPVVRQHVRNPPMYAEVAIGKPGPIPENPPNLCGENTIFRIAY